MTQVVCVPYILISYKTKYVLIDQCNDTFFFNLTKHNIRAWFSLWVFNLLAEYEQNVTSVPPGLCGVVFLYVFKKKPASLKNNNKS